MINDVTLNPMENVNQTIRNFNDNMISSGGIRMPRTHQLRFIEDQISTKPTNEVQKSEHIQICMNCQSTLSEIFVLEDDQIFDMDIFCYVCGVEVLAEKTVNNVLRKLSHNERFMKIYSDSDVVNKKSETDISNASNDNEPLQQGQISESNIGSCKESKDESQHEVSTDSFQTPIKTNVPCNNNDVSETAHDLKENLPQINSTTDYNTVPIITSQNLSNSQTSNKTVDMNDSSVSCNIKNHFELKISTTTLNQFYTNLEKIGSGRFGKVSKVIHKETNQVLAVKSVIYRSMETRKQILNEIQILDSLHGNDHILQLVEVIDSDKTKPKCINIITEYLEGGELYDQIAKDDLLTEVQVVNIMYQLLDGVNFIHDHGIIHRDIKPENIVFTSKESGHLKIIDFGFAIKFDDKSPPKTMVGTTVFVAPEVLRYESQSYLTDMWSIGVVAFNLLTGITPFEIPLTGDLNRQLTDREIIENIERCQYNFDDEGFIDVSEEAKDFISSLLIRNPSKRLTAKQCLKHKWLVSCHKANHNNVRRSITVQRMKNYVAIQKWQKIGIVIQSINHFKNAIMSSS